MTDSSFKMCKVPGIAVVVTCLFCLAGIQASAEQAADPATVAASEPELPKSESDEPAKEEAAGGASQLSKEAREAAKAGMDAFQQGDFTGASMSFQRMLALAPEHPAAMVNLATAQFQLGFMDEAEDLLRQAVRLDPDRPEVWTQLGIICLESGKLRSALAALSRSVEIDPKNPRTRSYLGTTLAEMGWMMGAEFELLRAIDLDDGYADAHFNLALVYLQRSPAPLALAKRHYDRSLELGSEPDLLVEKKLSDLAKKAPVGESADTTQQPVSDQDAASEESSEAGQ